MPDAAIVNKFESNGEFGFREEVLFENHGPKALVHLAVGQCDIPEALDVILDHYPDFEAWLIQTDRQAFAVPDESIGLYFLEDESPMENTGCSIISKPKSTKS